MIRFFLRAAGAPLLIALSMPGVQAQPLHGHVHGLVKLDVAIDVRAITIHVDAPLESIVGFERAPRTDAERKTTQQAVAQLRAAGKLFTIDPAAACTLAQVDLDAPALGLGEGQPAQASGHGDLEGNVVFECRSPVQARYIDMNLFDAFPGIRRIDVQIATPGGQYQRTLKRPAARLTWGRQ